MMNMHQNIKELMKYLKIKYIAFPCLISLLSCSQGDSPDGSDRTTEKYITFQTNLSDVNSTRGTQLTNTDFKSFKVSAYFGADASGATYFTGTTFTRQGTSNKFTSSPGYVWPATNMAFYAWLNESSSCTHSIGAANYTLSGFKVSNNIANHSDFVTAYTKTTFANFENDEANGVKLVFNHRLSQIAIKACSNSNKYSVEVAGVRLGNVPIEGTFNFTGTTAADGTNTYWSDTNKGVVEYMYGSGESIVTLGSEAVSIMKNGGNAMVIPTGSIAAWNPTVSPIAADGGTYISVLIRVTTTVEDGRVVQLYPAPGLDSKDQVVPVSFGGKEFAWAAVPINVTWEPGKYYTYTLNYSSGVGIRDPKEPKHPGDPILGGDVTTTVTLNDWEVVENETIPVPGTGKSN